MFLMIVAETKKISSSSVEQFFSQHLKERKVKSKKKMPMKVSHKDSCSTLAFCSHLLQLIQFFNKNWLKAAQNQSVSLFKCKATSVQG